MSNTLYRNNALHAARVAALSLVAGIPIILQDVVIAARFSTSGEADAYQLAVAGPLLAINIFSGGALLAILVPKCVALISKGGHNELTQLALDAKRALFYIALISSLSWGVLYTLYLTFFNDDMSHEAKSLSTGIVWLAVLAFLGAALAGVNNAILISYKRFVLNSLQPAFLPTGVILGILVMGHTLGVYGAAIGMLAGSLALYVLTTMNLKNHIRHDKAGYTQFFQSTKLKLGKDYWLSIASSMLLGGVYYSDYIFAASLAEGTVASFSYASRPVTLLSAFITTVISNISLSYFSHLFFRREHRLALKLYLFWLFLLSASVPAVITWHFYSDETVRLLYARGEFGPTQVKQVSTILSLYMLHLPFFVVGTLSLRVINGLMDSRTPLYMAAAAFTVNWFIDYRLLPDLGISGIVWGTNAAYATWGLIITIIALIRLHKLQSLSNNRDPI